MADTPDRAAAGLVEEFGFAPGKERDQRSVIQSVTHAEVRLDGRPREFDPGADELAVVAAIDAIADGAAKFHRDGALELDGEIGDAAPCIQPIGRDDGAGGAG